jgi:hypothetical protein
MIEDFVEGIIVENGFWTRLQFGADGRFQFTSPSPPTAGSSSCFCSLAGLGDDGLAAARQLLHEN